MLLMWEKSHCCAFPILHKHDVNTSLRAVMQQHHTLPWVVWSCKANLFLLLIQPSLLCWNGDVCQGGHDCACEVGDQCQFPTRTLYLAGKGAGWPSPTATHIYRHTTVDPNETLVHQLVVVCFLLKRRWVVNTLFPAVCMFIPFLSMLWFVLISHQQHPTPPWQPDVTQRMAKLLSNGAVICGLLRTQLGD